LIYDGVSNHHLKVISQALALLPQREYLLSRQELLRKAIDFKKQISLLSPDDYDRGLVQLALQAVELLKEPPTHPNRSKDSPALKQAGRSPLHFPSRPGSGSY